VISLIASLNAKENFYVRTQPSSGNSPAPYPRRKNRKAAQAPRRCFCLE